jgi:hemerythrin
LALLWTEALSIGVAEIDAQHRELFSRVDLLLQASLRGDRSQVGSLLAFLRDYVAVHFEAEERLMLERHYPGYRIHKAEHDRFARDLGAMEAELAASGPTDDLAARVNRGIAEWLRDHVYLTDTALGRFVRGLGEPT